MMYDVNVRILCQDDYFSKYTYYSKYIVLHHGGIIFLYLHGYTYVLSFYLLENKLGYCRLTKKLENNNIHTHTHKNTTSNKPLNDI